MRHLKWGIMATGGIAGRFAEALAGTEEATALAVASRSGEKAKAFAEKHGIERAFEGYDALLADPDVEAVYVALPNHLHAEWATKCAERGKHVLLEKPATINAAELERVIGAAKKSGVFLMEAFAYRCHPRMAKVREIIASGRIGELRTIQVGFHIHFRGGPENYRMKNAMGGGPLMDLGCYCVSFCRMIAGGEPESVTCLAQIDPETRVDAQAAGTLKFPSGLVASFSCGNLCGRSQSEAFIHGSKGSIEVTEPWGPVHDGAPIIIRTGDDEDVIEVKAGYDLYANEALTVAQHVDERQAPAMTWADSLGQARTMDALRARIGLRFDCE